jgi:hypothetical protein
VTTATRSTFPRYVAFLRVGRDDVGRAVRSMRSLGEDIPEPPVHPVLDRIVTDAVIDRLVAVVHRAEGALPAALRARLYRRVLRRERRQAIRSGSDRT